MQQHPTIHQKQQKDMKHYMTSLTTSECELTDASVTAALESGSPISAFESDDDTFAIAAADGGAAVGVGATRGGVLVRDTCGVVANGGVLTAGVAGVDGVGGVGTRPPVPVPPLAAGDGAAAGVGARGAAFGGRGVSHKEQ
jgi:hypothetical protein